MLPASDIERLQLPAEFCRLGAKDILEDSNCILDANGPAKSACVQSGIPTAVVTYSTVGSRQHLCDLPCVQSGIETTAVRREVSLDTGSENKSEAALSGIEISTAVKYEAKISMAVKPEEKTKGANNGAVQRATAKDSLGMWKSRMEGCKAGKGALHHKPAANCASVATDIKMAALDGLQSKLEASRRSSRMVKRRMRAVSLSGKEYALTLHNEVPELTPLQKSSHLHELSSQDPTNLNLAKLAAEATLYAELEAGSFLTEVEAKAIAAALNR